MMNNINSALIGIPSASSKESNRKKTDVRRRYRGPLQNNNLSPLDIKIIAAAKSNEIQSCQQLYTEIRAARIRPSRHTFTAIISMYVRDRNMESAYDMLTKMKECNATPDLVIYTIILNGYVKINDSEGVLRIFGILTHEKIKLDSIAYTCMIRFYTRIGNINEALAFFQDMKKEGIKPNIMTYHCLLYYYEKEKDRDSFCAIYNEMIKEGIEADRAIMNSYLQLLVNLDCIDEAKKLYLSQNQCVARVNNKVVDMHNLSSGAAYIALLIYLDTFEGKGSIIIVTGKGIHSNNNKLFETRDFIRKKLPELSRKWCSEIDEKNKGLLRIWCRKTSK